MIYPVRNWPKWYDAQPFGTKTDYGYHEAADLNLKTGGNTDLGQDILAIANGIVTSVHRHTNSNNFGLHVHIKHEGPWGVIWCHYAHCSEVLVQEGETVSEGQKVATVGKSGTIYSHLHWAIKLVPTGVDGFAKTKEELKKWTNPIEFVEKWMVKNVKIDESKSPSWLSQMFAEVGVDLARPEEEIRHRVQEVFDGFKKYTDLQKRVEKLEKDLGFYVGEAAKFETELSKTVTGREELKKEVDDLRHSLTAREGEIGKLQASIDELQKNIDPETNIIISKEEYSRLQKRRVTDRLSDKEVLKEALVRLWHMIIPTSEEIQKMRDQAKERKG